MTLSPRRYRQITVVALVALAVIIVAGAAVRLTNSGLGCDDWPNCNSTHLIDVSSKHAAIEQINRLFTGVVGLAVIAAVLGSLVRRPRRRDLIVLSCLEVVGVLGNAVLGGISVRVDLHPMFIQGHMLLSMFLIIVGTTLVRRAGEPDGVPRQRVVTSTTYRLVQVMFVMTCVAIVAGTVVTGAGPHAGDENAERLNIAVHRAAQVHSITVWVAVLIGAAIVYRVRRGGIDRTLMTPMSTWMFVALMQAALGYVQYLTGVPPLLVGLHVAGATAMMIATTQVVLDTTRPAGSDDGSLGTPVDNKFVSTRLDVSGLTRM